MSVVTAARADRRPPAVYAAAAVSLALGLLFIFVRAPHPWGWEGFDHYHDIALELARGRPFPTMEVPWGYAYFLAAFYRAFGDHPWIPLTVQAILNATVPVLVFDFASTWLDRRTAVAAALVTGVFSFNTVYASTQSSDAVCTWLFMMAVVAFAAACRRDDWRLFAIAGLLTGLAPQFRPNLILIPLVLAGFAVLQRRTAARVAQGALLVACAVAVLTPWIARNYRLTRSILPTSVHGGVQLWYGTLQTGPYLNSRAHNPRSVFDAPAFEYTSLSGVPLIVHAQEKGCVGAPSSWMTLYYWTDAEPELQLRTTLGTHGHYTFEIPPLERDGILYYYFANAHRVTTPAEGRFAPFVYFVSQDHLGDLDRKGDLLDVFDVVRLVRRDAWGEEPAFAARLHAAGVDTIQDAVTRLIDGADARVQLEKTDGTARATFADGSTLEVPRAWSGRITDVGISGGIATGLMVAHRSLAGLISPAAPRDQVTRCAELEHVAVNDVFYRSEPHMMHRYSALAFDNIRRDPLGFALASAYRAVRLFVIAGTSDPHTTQQFSRSRFVYAAGTIASLAYLLLFAAGVVVAWRRGDALWLPLLLIAYVPATIAPVLTNMRYTVTVQPLVFMFIAVAVMQLAGRRAPAAAPAARDLAETRTAPRL